MIGKNQLVMFMQQSGVLTAFVFPGVHLAITPDREPIEQLKVPQDLAPGDEMRAYLLGLAVHSGKPLAVVSMSRSGYTFGVVERC
ncbi:MAG: hypothetical protein WCP17_00480 [bacterium]